MPHRTLDAGVRTSLLQRVAAGILTGMRPEDQRAWLRQRRAGAVAVAEVEMRELRELDAAAALVSSEALLAAAPIATMTEARRETSGFVEQQRLFARARERGAEGR